MAEAVRVPEEVIHYRSSYVLKVIKIMVGGGVASETDAIETVQYSAEEIRAITSTCKQMGKVSTAHAYTIEAIRHAVDNGVKGIEHGNLLDVETAK
ncbi:hypothetical protein QFC22_004073 [Naganishia vaughanmartiniae]|uniref:Uncharacterized protein n=1 Tax=Naganishia vaughanmartiniae TaxID=1424756 RepID=A0ACC2X4A4_9TREE|nr:hypothetical protein QFC22_004073 [Naganishia vaughanmartiniae]